jgi:glycosyltransferase involved in cell wall biosynthesis
VTNEERVRLLQRCAALIVPGREDFGLATVEALAAGRPVLGYAKGGTLEIVRAGTTGTFFREPTVDALAEAMADFDPAAYDPHACRERAAYYDVEHFQKRFRAHLDALIMTRHDAGK